MAQFVDQGAPVHLGDGIQDRHLLLYGSRIRHRCDAHDFFNRLVHRLRHDSVFLVVLLLNRAAAIGFVYSPLHRISDGIRVENHLAVHVSCRTTGSLYERPFGSEETFLVGVQNSHQRHFGQIESLTQKIDTHQHVKLSSPKGPEDLHTFYRVDGRMKVAHADVQTPQIIRQVFGHPFREGGHQHPLLTFRAFPTSGH